MLPLPQLPCPDAPAAPGLPIIATRALTSLTVEPAPHNAPSFLPVTSDNF